MPKWVNARCALIWFLFADACCRMESVKVYLSGIQPFTGAWPAGTSLVLAAQIMVTWVNQNPTLLQGYELEIIWQDSKCDQERGAELGARLFLENFLADTFWPFKGPNRSLTGIKAVGIFGAGCSQPTAGIAPLAYYNRMPMISNAAKRPSLSDRARFPGFFRTVASDSGFNAAWLAVIKDFDFDEVAVVVGDRSNDWQYMVGPFLQEAERHSIKLVGPALTYMDHKLGLGQNYVFHGWELGEFGPAAVASSAVIWDEFRLLSPAPPRFMVLLLFAQQARPFICSAVQKKVSGVIFMMLGWLTPFWWRNGLQSIPCTSQGMDEALNLTITASMWSRRSDLATRLTCTNGRSAQEFFTEIDDLVTSFETHVRPEVASTADAVCAFALMLHELLIVRNRSLPELQSYNQELYNDALEILSATDFEGTQGRMRFLPGLPDPDQDVMIEQLQNEARGRNQGRVLLARYDGNKLTWSGLPIMLPGGKTAVPQKTGPVQDARLVYGESGAFGAFKSCESGTVLNMGLNLCEDCPATKTYTVSSRACECKPGYINHGVECIACPVGSFSDETGSSTCRQCNAGEFVDSIAATHCKKCDQGRYSSLRGGMACEACPSTTTTKLVGAMTITQCVCPKQSYYLRALHECVHCTLQELVALHCPGYFAPYESSNGSMAQERDVFDETILVKRFYMATYTDDKLTGFECLYESDCSRDRQIFQKSSEIDEKAMCFGQASGLACAECVEDTFRDVMGDCRFCHGTSIIYLISVGLGGLLAISCALIHGGMCRSTPMSCVQGIILSYAQALALCLNLDVNYESIDQGKGSGLSFRRVLTEFFTLDPTLLSLPLACYIGPSFLNHFVLNLFLPMALVGVLCSIFLGSHLLHFSFKNTCSASSTSKLHEVVSKAVVHKYGYSLSMLWPLAWQDLVNTLIVVFVKLFISTANVALSIFKFQTHPSGARTVHRFLQVKEKSSQWWASLPVSLVGVCLYVIGPFAFMTYIVLVAPQRAGDPAKGHSFRRAYRAMWRSFHPGAWWFGLVQLLYGLGLNMTMVLFANGRTQLIVAIFLATGMVLMVVLMRPWKFALNLQSSAVAVIGLAFMLVLLLNVEGTSPLDQSVLGKLVYLFAALPLFLMLAETLFHIMAHRREKVHLTTNKRRADLGESLHDIASILSARSTTEIRKYTVGLPDNDRAQLRAAINSILFTMLGLQPKHFWHRRCGNVPFEIAIDGRVEGELLAHNLGSPGDPRAEIRRLRKALIECEEFLGHTPSAESIAEKLELRTQSTESVHNTGLIDEVAFAEAICAHLKRYYQGAGVFSNEQLVNVFRYCDYGDKGSITKAEILAHLWSVPEPVLPKSTPTFLRQVTSGFHLQSSLRKSDLKHSSDPDFPSLVPFDQRPPDDVGIATKDAKDGALEARPQNAQEMEAPFVAVEAQVQRLEQLLYALDNACGRAGAEPSRSILETQGQELQEGGEISTEDVQMPAETMTSEWKEVLEEPVPSGKTIYSDWSMPSIQEIDGHFEPAANALVPCESAMDNLSATADKTEQRLTWECFGEEIDEDTGQGAKEVEPREAEIIVDLTATVKAMEQHLKEMEAQASQAKLREQDAFNAGFGRGRSWAEHHYETQHDETQRANSSA